MTDTASYAGQAVGWLLIVWGFARLLAGDFLGGVWPAFIGWFLNNAAESTRHGEAQRETLRGMPVGSPLDQAPAVATAGLSVQDFAFEQVLQRGHRALPIVDDGRLVGIVTLGRRKEAAAGCMADHAGGENHDIRTPEDGCSRYGAECRDWAHGGSGLHQLPVLQDGRVVGLLSRADIVRFLQLRPELHLATAPVSRGDAGVPTR